MLKFIAIPNKNETLRCRSVPWTRFAGMARSYSASSLGETGMCSILNWNHYKSCLGSLLAGLVLLLPCLLSAQGRLEESAFEAAPPAFLSDSEILADLQVALRVVRENYGRYHELEQSGTNWEAVFRDLGARLVAEPNPVLTHHFQERLIEALGFTRDPLVSTDLFLKRRHYHRQVEPLAPFTTRLQLVKQSGRLRTLPLQQRTGVANQWLQKCDSPQARIFPVPSERSGEQRFELGLLAAQRPAPLTCTLEDNTVRLSEHVFRLTLPSQPRNAPKSPIFRYEGGRVPYVRWYRDGDRGERRYAEFMRLATRLQRSDVLVLDVRGNHSGSFGFIERWLRELTSSGWENVVVRERHSRQTLTGLLNRTEWGLRLENNRTPAMRHALTQKRQQLAALLQRFEENNLPEKWVETKFLFNGKRESPAWKRKLIVIANTHCGDGCQFLAALAKQQDNAFLFGTPTGHYPRRSLVPLYQLPNSRIFLSVNHRVHLDTEGRHIEQVGYEPDAWVFDDSVVPQALRFAESGVDGG